MEQDDLEYVGFWPRVGAALIDTVLLCAILYPALTWIYGGDYWLDPRKQGWHDKLAGTVVVRSRHRGPAPVRFEPPG
jgi:uncharacterized RDD family membrane protein YckC